MEATKSFYCVEHEGIVDYNTINKWFKKFWLGCRNIDDLEKSSRPKTINFKTVFQAVLENQVSLAFHSNSV